MALLRKYRKAEDLRVEPTVQMPDRMVVITWRAFLRLFKKACLAVLVAIDP